MEGSPLKLHLYHPSPSHEARGSSQKGLEERESQRWGNTCEIMFSRQGRWTDGLQGGEKTGSSDPTLAEHIGRYQPLEERGQFISTTWVAPGSFPMLQWMDQHLGSTN